MTKERKETIRMNISMDVEFYELIQEAAAKDYLKPSTWVKQYLMRGLLENKNKKD